MNLDCVNPRGARQASPPYKGRPATKQNLYPSSCVSTRAGRQVGLLSVLGWILLGLGAAGACAESGPYLKTQAPSSA